MSAGPAAGRSTARVWVASAEEAEDVARLMAEFRDWQNRERPTDDSIRRSVERLLTESGAEYLLGAAGEGRMPTAVCQLRYRYGLWHAAEDCWLEDLFVSAGARGDGLGTALVEAAMTRARGRGCRRVELDVDSDNSGALALYGRAGFSAETPAGATRLMMRRSL